MSVSTQNTIQFYRGDDVVIMVNLKDINCDVLDYAAYDWESYFRYSENSSQFFPGVIVLDTDVTPARLEITFPKEQTNLIAGNGFMDLQSTKKDDGTVKTWFKAEVVFVEDVTYHG